MTCKDFHHWLTTRDVRSDLGTPDVLDHLQVCSDCRAIYHTDLKLEKSIQTAFLQEDIPNGLRDQIELTLDHAAKPVITSRKRVAALVASVALILIVGWVAFFSQPFRYQNLRQLSEKAIVMHLKGNTTMSFTADEMEQATAMMSKALKFNVIIPDLTHKGYTLLGGRLCVLDECKIAYLFYEKHNKLSSLVIMDYDYLGFEMADGSSFSNDIKGCHTDIWKEKGQVYAMVY